MRHDNSTRWMRWLVTLAALTLLAGACSSSDDDGASPFGFDADTGDSDGDSDGGGGGDDGGSDGGSDDSGSNGGDAGDPGAAAGETEGGVPFPAGGLDILADAGIQIGGQKQLEYPAERADEIIAFFESWVDTQSGQVVSAQIDDARTWQVFEEGGSALVASITVETDFPESAGDGIVTFVLIVEP